jgi:hypothetical protein
MPTAEMPMPYTPATLAAMRIAAAIAMIGNTVLSSPTAKPVMMLVAGPVCDASAIFKIGPELV